MAEVHSASLVLAVVERRSDIVGVGEVAGMVVVDRARNLEQTPSLIDPHVADKVRNAGAAVSRVNTGDERARRTIEADATAGRTTDRIDDLRAVEGVRAAVVDTQRR